MTLEEEECLVPKMMWAIYQPSVMQNFGASTKETKVKTQTKSRQRREWSDPQVRKAASDDERECEALQYLGAYKAWTCDVNVEKTILGDVFNLSSF